MVNSSLGAHIYLSSGADRVGVANLNIISHSPLTSYYQTGVYNDGISCSISQPFQFSGVENGNVSVSKSFHAYNISLGTLYLLSDHYTQFSNYLNFNYTIHDLITLGIGQKIITVNEEENYNYAITDIGCKIYKDKTKFAVNYTNLLQKESSKIELPNIVTTEISYSPTDDTDLAIGLEKEKNHQFSTSLGIRYKVMESLTLLSGYSLEPNQISFGLSINYQRFNVNYAIVTRPELNSTHHISLIYEM